MIKNKNAKSTANLKIRYTVQLQSKQTRGRSIWINSANSVSGKPGENLIEQASALIEKVYTGESKLTYSHENTYHANVIINNRRAISIGFHHALLFLDALLRKLF